MSEPHPVHTHTGWTRTTGSLHYSAVQSGKATGKAIEGLFWQYANVLIRKGWVDCDELYVDETKIESKANRYSFVWRKVVEQGLKKVHGFV